MYWPGNSVGLLARPDVVLLRYEQLLRALMEVKQRSAEQFAQRICQD